MNPRALHLGTLLDTLEERGSPTRFHLGRPFDIAPEGGTEYDIPALAALVRRTAGWLAAAGAGPGDHVAVVKRNHWDCVLLACAAARLAAVPVLICGELPATAVAELLARVRPAVLVTQRRFLHREGEPEARHACPAGQARRTVCLDGPAPGAVARESLLDHPAPAPRRRRDGEPLIVNHTSGTTGVPKLVVHSTETLVRAIAAVEAHRWPVMGVRRRDTVATATSFSHGRAVSWTLSTLWLTPRKILAVADAEPAAVVPLLQAHPPTVLEAPPATYQRWQHLAQGPDGPFRRVRLFASTFDAVHPPTVRAFLGATAHPHPVWGQAWGQTETGPLTFRFTTRATATRAGRRHPATRDVGRPVPGLVRLRIVHPETFAPQRRGRPGLVLVRTRARCLGYLGEQPRWARKAGAGWVNTGDIGVRTRSGRLLLLDREVDRVPGLSCLELEDVLHDRLPEVQEVVVLGRVAEPPVPVLVTRDGRLDPARWRRAARDLAALAEPVVTTWEAVSRTGTGKVRRHELRRRLLGGAPAPGTGRWT